MPLSGSLLQTLNALTSAAVRIVAIFTLTVAKMPHNLLIDRCLRPFCEGIVRLDGESGADALFVALGIRQKPSPVPKAAPGNSNSAAPLDQGAFWRLS